MARQTYYVGRDMKHPLYRTRMLTAGQALTLDAGGAALFRKLGVELNDQKPKAAKVEAPAPVAPPAPPKPKAARKRKAKK